METLRYKKINDFLNGLTDREKKYIEKKLIKEERNKISDVKGFTITTYGETIYCEDN